MKIAAQVLLLSLLSGLSTLSHAVVIDTSGDWSGVINDRIDQSAQTLNFGSDVTLDSFTWYLGMAHIHTVSVVEWSGGPGAILFSTTQAWTAGPNEILPNVTLSAGTQYAIWFDYLGSILSTVHINNEVAGYSDGEWWFFSGSWIPRIDIDLRFVANLTEAVSVPEPGTRTRGPRVSVPEPGTLALLGIGLAGMGLARRRKKVKSKKDYGRLNNI